MDKRKLIQIIEKELEELKVITEEVSENEKDTGLIIEIALGKARVLCQEIELLQTLSAKEKAIQDLEPEEEDLNDDDGSDVAVSDPELEIATPGEDGEDSDYSPDEFDEADALDEDLEDDDLTDEDDDPDEEIGEDEQSEREGLIEFEHTAEIDADEEEEALEQPVIEKTEFRIEPQPDFREINLEDDNEEEPVAVKSSPMSTVTERSVIKEIPKPEEPAFGKKPGNETFHKGPTLNETIGEGKTAETTISSGSVTSLRAAIGLNDRFLFIREIFGNNTEKYNKIIDHLDKLETIQQAVDYLKSQLTLQKNDTSLKFVELLKRRFTK